MILILTALALLPTIVLLIYIYQKDKVEKEPKKLLLKIFLLGFFSFIPILIVEILFQNILTLILAEGTFIFAVLDNFLGVALVEEFFKRLAVILGAWKNKEFNYRFDGIVYGVVSALGFATIENVMYVFQFGLSTAIVRAIAAVPSHAIDGLFMGYYLGLAKQAEIWGDKKGKRRFMLRSLWIPVAMHGLYDLALELNSGIIVMAWFVCVIGLEIYAFTFISKTSKADMPLYTKPRFK